MCDKKQQDIPIPYRYNYVVKAAVDPMNYQTCDRSIALSDDCTSLSSKNPPAATTTLFGGDLLSGNARKFGQLRGRGTLPPSITRRIGQVDLMRPSLVPNLMESF